MPPPEKLHSIPYIERGVGYGAEPDERLIRDELHAVTVGELLEALAHVHDIAKTLSAAVMAPALAEREPQEREVLFEHLLPLLASAHTYHIELHDQACSSKEDLKLWETALKSIFKMICALPGSDRLPDYVRAFPHALRNAEPYAVRRLISEASSMGPYGQRIGAIVGAAKALRDGVKEGGQSGMNAADGISWLKEEWRNFPEESAAIDCATAP